ncbi:MAG: DUF192 domain-containing protein [Oligoflexia bacterium]|nr:DUF192 domain-containing protein [Oligoflexia bacterium]
MSKLFKKEKSFFIADLIPAKSLKQRIQGLTSYSHLKEKEAFWISACPSVHTFFMKFPIDVVFTDRQFKIVALFSEVQTGKILFGGFKSRNVFEMKAGQISACRLKKGDLLHVES